MCECDDDDAAAAVAVERRVTFSEEKYQKRVGKKFSFNINKQFSIIKNEAKVLIRVIYKPWGY